VFTPELSHRHYPLLCAVTGLVRTLAPLGLRWSAIILARRGKSHSLFQRPRPSTRGGGGQGASGAKYPKAVQRFLALPLSSQAKRKCLWDNCAKLYGFDA